MRSAAKGGYTDVATMPNTTPTCDTGAIVTYQVEKARAAGLSRVHPIGALTKGERGESLAEIGDMYRAGACAFSDDGRGVQSAGMLRSAMDYLVQFDRCAISHCQDESLVGTGVVNEGERLDPPRPRGLARPGRGDPDRPRHHALRAHRMPAARRPHHHRRGRRDGPSRERVAGSR